VRTTLTLDDDVAAKLKSRARRTGRAFKDVVNQTLRLGLEAAAGPVARKPFIVKARDLGRVRPGLDLDNVADVLERVEGPGHR
jgi:plasmid stability protein